MQVSDLLTGKRCCLPFVMSEPNLSQMDKRLTPSASSTSFGSVK
ncbi:unnamed protein product [Anisakis simplex]|uniref:Uncharacterized protein n=1 Tax=Anisakis simplex TaxID=6269 RepID=A0A0M3JQ04_ANISI|nr:unnamed protein product [Anisakis simplex]